MSSGPPPSGPPSPGPASPDSSVPPVSGASLDSLTAKIYEQLHRLAVSYMRAERANHTLQPTALVHEAYLRLLSQHSVDFANRAQVLGIAAQMMRRILLNHEERRRTDKRGGEYNIVCITDSIQPASRETPLHFVEVNAVLNRLQAMDERQAKIAELRIFGELSAEEIAEFLHVSVATVRRDWSTAKLWLAQQLRPVR